MVKKTLKPAPGSAGRSGVSLGDSVAREIARLDGLGVAPLRSLWARRFRGPAPPIQSADILRRLMAWKIQVEAFGDLDRETQRRLRDMARNVAKGQSVIDSKAGHMRAGMVLVREWRGIEHRVLVLDRAFEHNGKRYKSLTQAARAITGTRWSGPRFFGLDSEYQPIAKTKPKPSATTP